MMIFCLAALSAGIEFPAPNQVRSIVVSNVTYTITYALKSTNQFSRPLTNPIGQPHYDCTATIYQGTNQIGGAIDTQWTPSGCFEDSPMMLVGRACNWKRYPNDSAGKGLHWVVSGPAMYSEPD